MNEPADGGQVDNRVADVQQVVQEAFQDAFGQAIQRANAVLPDVEIRRVQGGMEIRPVRNPGLETKSADQSD